MAPLRPGRTQGALAKLPPRLWPGAPGVTGFWGPDWRGGGSTTEMFRMFGVVLLGDLKLFRFVTTFRGEIVALAPAVGGRKKQCDSVVPYGKGLRCPPSRRRSRTARTRRPRRRTSLDRGTSDSHLGFHPTNHEMKESLRSRRELTLGCRREGYEHEQERRLAEQRCLHRRCKAECMNTTGNTTYKNL